ncbi:non-ribosomal peptide synthetase [Roseivivax sp. CAU 1753]
MSATAFWQATALVPSVGGRDCPMTDTDPTDVFAFPLSFSQRALWFMYELQPESVLYHVPFLAYLDGPLDCTALKLGFEWLAERHEILRTTFQRIDGEVRQVVHPKLAPPFNLIRMPPETDDIDDRIADIVETIARQPFNLRQEPPIAVTVIQRAPDRHVLLLMLHHIACDGTSLPILLEDLSLGYEALREARKPDLADPALQYGDYAVWQRRCAEEGQFEDALAFWQNHLRDAPRLSLQADRRAGALEHEGATHSIDLQAPLMDKLQALGEHEGATLFMTLLAAFKLLLHRQTGQSDIVVGTPSANRNHADIERLVGFFINPLALRTRLTPDMTFRALLQSVRDVCVDGFSHQDVPFELVVDRCKPRHPLGQQPFFGTMFMVHSLPADMLSFPGVSLRPGRIRRRTSKFDLTWNIFPDGAHHKLEVEYNRGCFDPETIARLARQYQTLLCSIADTPDIRLSQAQLSDQAERQDLLETWNDTTTAFPAQACVHQVFERQVTCAPDAIAIVDGARQISYRNLNRRANRLARDLIRRGLEAETPVALFLPQSDMIFVAMLAVLKAGGIYVPLDPDSARERLDYLLNDIDAPLVLTTRALKPDLPVTPATVLCLDDATDTGAISRHDDTNLPQRVHSDNLAYVLYTSGSTGTPKGVGISHRAINRLATCTNYLSVDASDSVAQTLNLSFDGSTFETWSALLNGARLVLFPKSLLLSPQKFTDHTERHLVSVMLLTTTLFNLVVRDAPWAFNRASTVLFGGEAVTPSFVQDVLRSGGPTRLLHIYGPTEATTFATWHHVTSVDPQAINVPIGRGISNTQLFILDQGGALAPVGAAGELCIGGDGLARGYHNGAALTAERFVPSSFGDHGQRLYRSGDLCRWRADGAIEYLSRLDEQLKIRGVRVEPREIETALLAHPYVSAAVVVATGEDHGARRLDAYVQPVGYKVPEADELRQFVSRKLHYAVVPTTFTILDTFPLMHSGKVDTRRLPEPRSVRPASGQDQDPPHTETEEMLALVWGKLLGVEGISRRDHFLDLGGHSQLAAELAYRMEDLFQVTLPLTVVYDYPTIAELAKCIEQHKDAGAHTAKTGDATANVSFDRRFAGTASNSRR